MQKGDIGSGVRKYCPVIQTLPLLDAGPPGPANNSYGVQDSNILGRSVAVQSPLIAHLLLEFHTSYSIHF
jgi:hypothetical protein